MGLGKWLQKRGSTGSIARWTAKHFQALRAQSPDLSDSEICEQILAVRYSTPVRLKPDEELALNKSLEIQGKPRDVRSLAYLIWDVEIGSQLIELPDMGSHQRSQCQDIIDEELDRLGLD